MHRRSRAGALVGYVLGCWLAIAVLGMVFQTPTMVCMSGACIVTVSGIDWTRDVDSALPLPVLDALAGCMLALGLGLWDRHLLLEFQVGYGKLVMMGLVSMFCASMWVTGRTRDDSDDED